MNANANKLAIVLQVLLTTTVTVFLAVRPAHAADPVISVTWDETPAPTEDVDYEIHTTNPAFPDVELIAESLTWRIWSTDTDNPNNIGDIGAITCPHPENFGVKILDASDGPGARNVTNLELEPDGDSYYSRIIEASITGDLGGNLSVQRSTGGTGGDLVSVTIDGQVSYDVTAHQIDWLEIGDALKGDLEVDIISENGVVWLRDELDGDVTVSDKLDTAAFLTIVKPDPASRIDVNEMANSSRVRLGGFWEHNGFSGRLILRSGVPVAGEVFIWGQFGTSGTVDLSNQPVYGRLFLEDGGSGQVINGGAIWPSGEVRLTDGDYEVFSGTASFGDLAGLIFVAGWGASLEGAIAVNGNITAGGRLRVTGDLQAGADIKVTGNVIDDEDHVEILIQGDCDGDIEVGGNLYGNVTVEGKLETKGRIIVDGLCDRPITIGQETQSQSLIHILGGLYSNGKIVINADEGYYDANGAIRIGPATWTTLPSIVFDGSIEINDDAQGNAGDLVGRITVVGCHATTADLDICICGGDGGGNVGIAQTGCQNQVDWSCVSGCD